MKVNNWDKWQTFRKDRGTPPWIKIYRNLLSNEQWVELNDSEKGQLVSIWILAADKNGTIPDSPKMIQRMAMLDKPPNINKFIELGFLASTCQPHDNQELKPCQQLDAPEKSRVEKSRGEKKGFTKPTRDDVNLYATENNLNLKGFFDYYESNGWKVGKNPMKKWKSSASGWSSRQNSYGDNNQDFSDTSTDWVNQDHGIII